MDEQTFLTLRDEARCALRECRLSDALRVVRGLAENDGHGAFLSPIAETEAAYGMMLDYMERGYADPERDRLFQCFLRDAHGVLDGISRARELRSGNGFYASLRRTLDRLQTPDWPAIALRLSENGEAQFLEKSARSSMAATQRAKALREEHVRLYKQLFEAVFTGGAWRQAEEDAARALCSDDFTDEKDKRLFVSAVTLSLLHLFDAAKFRFLFEQLDAASPAFRARVQVGLVLSYVKHYERLQLYPELTARLTLLGDAPQFCADMLRLQLQLLMSLETKNIERNMREEILPDVMREASRWKSGKGLDLEKLALQDADLGTNPDWLRDENVEKIERKMKELTDLHARGADIFIGSFSVAKQRFPFFDSAANWLYPFTPDHPELPPGTKDNAFARLFLGNESLCNSDRYSFCLILGKLPFPQVEGLRSQMEQALEAAGQSALRRPAAAPADVEAERRIYLQDLYRFFKLYRLREEADDPFRLDLLLTGYAPFSGFFASDDALRQLADFTFREKNYLQALPFFETLAERAPSADCFQKAGFCHQNLKAYDKAAAAYEKANLLKPDSAWTLGQLAHCYRMLRRYEEAAACYREMEAMRPDDTRLLLRLSECYIRLERYDEAFEKLYKADYLDNGSGRALKALAWCSFMTGKTEQAARYYEQLLAAAPTAEDLLNAGHAAWVAGNVAQALERYGRAVDAEKLDFAPAGFFAEDADVLKRFGKTETELRLMLDLINRRRMAS